MAALKKIPLLDSVLSKMIDMSTQFDAYSEAVGNYFRITEKTNPRVYHLYQLALARLGMEEEYPLFSKLSYDYNAYTMGVERPFIVLHSSVIAEYSDGELLHIIGHEIGHIKSGHVLYLSMARMLNSFVGNFSQAAMVALGYAIMEWSRNAEYTADRAGVIASGDIDASNMMTMKLLGHSGNIPDIDFNLEEVMKQVDDFYLDKSGIINQLLFINYTIGATHPWSILRLKQINDWYQSGELEEIVAKYR